jgi:hypothetical protein
MIYFSVGYMVGPYSKSLYTICFFYVSVFFGANESASGGVKVKSILFQDSVQFSGLVVSAMFDFNKFFNIIKLFFLP